jgi:hypothetical protein
MNSLLDANVLPPGLIAKKPIKIFKSFAVSIRWPFAAVECH